MRFLMTVMGSHGDVHPFLAVALALQARGHDALMLAPRYFERDVTAAGVAFAPIGERHDALAMLRDPDIMHPRRSGLAAIRYIAEAMPEMATRVREAIGRFAPDVLVSHHACFASPWVAREAGVPLALGILVPMLWFAPSDPVPAMQASEGKTRERLARFAMRGKPMIGRIGDFWLNRLRRRCGMAPARGLFLDAFLGGDLSLGLWSPALRPPLPGDPAQGVICGFPWYDRSDRDPALTAETEQFLAAGDPPVVFTLGTAAVHTARDFYVIAAEACRIAGLRGVLLHGGVAPVPGDLPRSIHALAYAPYSLLLPRAAATVHHAGIGSTAQAMRAGRPSVAVPHAHDQFNNALRGVKLGVAAKVDRRDLTPQRLAAALRAVLDDPSYAARAAPLGARLASEDGAVTAALHLAALAARSTGKA